MRERLEPQFGSLQFGAWVEPIAQKTAWNDSQLRSIITSDTSSSSMAKRKRIPAGVATLTLPSLQQLLSTPTSTLTPRHHRAHLQRQPQQSIGASMGVKDVLKCKYMTIVFSLLIIFLPLPTKTQDCHLKYLDVLLYMSQWRYFFTKEITYLDQYNHIGN